MACKVTMIFDVTTNPENPTYASAHSGGWSESLWSPGGYVPIGYITSLTAARAAMLPSGASIVGVRQGLYTINENKFLPGGTSVYKLLVPGNSAYTINLPQDSLEETGTSNSSINSNRFRLGCLPDECVQRGEFNGLGSFVTLVNAYNAILTAGGAESWFFTGRVLSNPSARVMSITPGLGNTAVIVLSGLVGAIVGTSYLRLNRVYSDIGDSVRGTFMTVAGSIPPSYTITGYTGGVVTHPNGTARVDQVGLFGYGSVSISRAVVKKIGRPSQSYRGRQSNRT